MSYANKCDRCGVCFDPLHMKGMMCRFINPRFETSNNIRERVIGKLLLDKDPDVYVDLCPECAEAFEAFMSTCDKCRPSIDKPMIKGGLVDLFRVFSGEDTDGD